MQTNSRLPLAGQRIATATLSAGVGVQSLLLRAYFSGVI